MKRKYLNLALIYALVAMVGGIFFREFRKSTTLRALPLWAKYTPIFLS